MRHPAKSIKEADYKIQYTTIDGKLNDYWITVATINGYKKAETIMNEYYKNKMPEYEWRLYAEPLKRPRSRE